jgi:hypothetical protein
VIALVLSAMISRVCVYLIYCAIVLPGGDSVLFCSVLFCSGGDSVHRCGCACQWIDHSVRGKDCGVSSLVLTVESYPMDTVR